MPGGGRQTRPSSVFTAYLLPGPAGRCLKSCFLVNTDVRGLRASRVCLGAGVTAGDRTRPLGRGARGLDPRRFPSTPAGGSARALLQIGQKCGQVRGAGSGRHEERLPEKPHSHQRRAVGKRPVPKGPLGGRPAGRGRSEGLTLVPSFPVRPGSPCSPGGPGGPGWPRSPIGPVSPVGPCGENQRRSRMSGGAQGCHLLSLDLRTAQASRQRAHTLNWLLESSRCGKVPEGKDQSQPPRRGGATRWSGISGGHGETGAGGREGGASGNRVTGPAPRSKPTVLAASHPGRI